MRRHCSHCHPIFSTAWCNGQTFNVTVHLSPDAILLQYTCKRKDGEEGWTNEAVHMTAKTTGTSKYSIRELQDNKEEDNVLSWQFVQYSIKPAIKVRGNRFLLFCNTSEVKLNKDSSALTSSTYLAGIHTAHLQKWQNNKQSEKYSLIHTGSRR